MSYLPADRALAPVPDDDDAAFWAHCNERKLRFQCCPRCAMVVHPPIAVCPGCQGFERSWIDAPAQASVFAFTWIHTAADNSVIGCLPYNVVLVEFSGLPEVRLVSNVIDVPHAQLATGDLLELVWEATDNGQMLPRFRKI